MRSVVLHPASGDIVKVFLEDQTTNDVITTD